MGGGVSHIMQLGSPAAAAPSMSSRHQTAAPYVPRTAQPLAYRPLWGLRGWQGAGVEKRILSTAELEFGVSWPESDI